MKDELKDCFGLNADKGIIEITEGDDERN